MMCRKFGRASRRRSAAVKAKGIRYKDRTLDSTLFASMEEASGSESKGEIP
jgi:hypothetical protein